MQVSRDALTPRKTSDQLTEMVRGDWIDNERFKRMHPYGSSLVSHGQYLAVIENYIVNSKNYELAQEIDQEYTLFKHSLEMEKELDDAAEAAEIPKVFSTIPAHAMPYKADVSVDDKTVKIHREIPAWLVSALIVSNLFLVVSIIVDAAQ